MSDQENNNQPPSSPSATRINTSAIATSSGTQSSGTTFIRDSKFYYRDGSAVFLVKNTLFKFQASLLDPHDGAEDYEFKDLMKYTLEGFEDYTDKPGSSDANPIVLPADVTLGQFRDFLTVVISNVSDFFFLTDIQAPSTPSLLPLSRYINLGYLGSRFGMWRLDEWSQLQIQALLREFVVKHRLKDDCNVQIITQLVQYMQHAIVTRHRQELFGLIRQIICPLVLKAYQLDNQVPQGKIINVCVALYKEKDLLICSPGFFGFIFAVIVSLGHQSPIWADCLTRVDRRVLYAAHSALTCLSAHDDLELGWVADPTTIKNVCTQCSDHFDSCWNNTFYRHKGLKSRIPLEDIRYVVALSEYHVRFSGLMLNKACTCSCPTRMSENIELYIETSYRNLTKKYERLVETV